VGVYIFNSQEISLRLMVVMGKGTVFEEVRRGVHVFLEVNLEIGNLLGFFLFYQFQTASKVLRGAAQKVQI
jgi:hypothetical protein